MHSCLCYVIIGCYYATENIKYCNQMKLMHSLRQPLKCSVRAVTTCKCWRYCSLLFFIVTTFYTLVIQAVHC